MRRRLSTLLDAASLVLSAATVVMWARSRWGVDLVDWRSGTHGVHLWSSSGVLVAHKFTKQGGGGGGPVDDPWSLYSAAHDGAGLYFYIPPDELGFGWRDESDRWGAFNAEVRAPHWFVAPAAAAPPAAWLAHRSGLCPACGYDLRATPARCPECGAAGARPNCPGERLGGLAGLDPRTAGCRRPRGPTGRG